MSNTGLSSGLSNSPKQRQPGPPFVATSANNGLCVDPITGKIVLGNDAGLLTAQLLSNRDIPLNNFFVEFIGRDNGSGVFNNVLIGDGEIDIIRDSNVDSQPIINLIDSFTGDTSFIINTVGIMGLVSNRSITLAQNVASSNRSAAQISAAGVTGVLTNTQILSLIGSWNTAGICTGLLVDIGHTASGAGSRAFDVKINAVSQFSVDVSGNLINTGSLTTGNPGSGSGSWLLGVPVVAASVLDGTQYLEVKVNGVIRKIALIV